MKIGIIVGSVRDNRFGPQVGQWVLDKAQVHGGAEFELINVADFHLPFVTNAMPPMMLGRNYDTDGITAWSNAINDCDGFIFVTGEYNHAVPGAFKNAVDHLASEWQDKAIAYVSYSWDGGVRAVEQWRLIMTNFNMYSIRAQVALNFPMDSTDGQLTPAAHREGEISGLLDSLIAATTKLRS